MVQIVRKKIVYVCEDCGSEFESKVKRSWAKFCATCIGKRRARGEGPRQQALCNAAVEDILKALHSLSKAVRKAVISRLLEDLK